MRANAVLLVCLAACGGSKDDHSSGSGTAPEHQLASVVDPLRSRLDDCVKKHPSARGPVKTYVVAKEDGTFSAGSTGLPRVELCMNKVLAGARGASRAQHIGEYWTFGADKPATPSAAPSGRFLVAKETISDQLMELEWARAGSSRGWTWHDAQKFCDELVAGGHDDWRLPSAVELDSVHVTGIPGDHEWTCTYAVERKTAISVEFLTDIESPGPGQTCDRQLYWTADKCDQGWNAFDIDRSASSYGLACEDGLGVHTVRCVRGEPYGP